jgi:hypothetical protein
MSDKQAAQGHPSIQAGGTPPSKGNGAGKGEGTPKGKEFANRFGLPTATALVVGSIIGTGVFALPSALAPYGPSSRRRDRSRATQVACDDAP